MQTILLLVSYIAVASARCGVGLVQGPAPSDCYKFVSSADSWYSAEWQCGKLGGHLASVGNAFANSFLKSEVPSWCSGDYWLGGSNDDRTTTWAWTDGTPFNYKNWDARQPGTGSPLCLAASTTSGKWSAQACHQPRPYVCKVPATDDVSPTQTPPACTDNSEATGVCVCDTYTCDEGQYCHKFGITKCVDRCAVVGVSVSVCQCVPATGGGVGSVCDVGQTCQSDGACAEPAPPACPAGRRAPAVCTCNDQQCVTGQICDPSGVGACSPTICPATGSAPSGGCICGDDGMRCNKDYTCNAATGVCTAPALPACVAGVPSTAACTCVTVHCVTGQICDPSGVGACSPSICPATGGAPYGGCICGEYGAMCGQDYTCNPATGTCVAPGLPACTDNARTTGMCACGRNTCTTNHYCHMGSNQNCFDTCPSGRVVSGIACLCVPAAGGGDGNICMPGGMCYADGACSAPAPTE